MKTFNEFKSQLNEVTSENFLKTIKESMNEAIPAAAVKELPMALEDSVDPVGKRVDTSLNKVLIKILNGIGAAVSSPKVLPRKDGQPAQSLVEVEIDEGTTAEAQLPLIVKDLRAAGLKTKIATGKSFIATVPLYVEDEDKESYVLVISAISQSISTEILFGTRAAKYIRENPWVSSVEWEDESLEEANGQDELAISPELLKTRPSQ